MAQVESTPHLARSGVTDTVSQQRGSMAATQLRLLPGGSRSSQDRIATNSHPPHRAEVPAAQLRTDLCPLSFPQGWGFPPVCNYGKPRMAPSFLQTTPSARVALDPQLAGCQSMAQSQRSLAYRRDHQGGESVANEATSISLLGSTSLKV